MKIQTMAALMSAALFAGMLGCNSKPVSVVEVDQSVLPPPAKAMLPQEATYDRVEEETYGNGSKVYVVTYTLNGEQKKIKYNSKDQSEPSRVFGQFQSSK
jgi:hypothetical protein